MQFSNILIASTAALAGTVQATDCVTGLLYCGSSLLNSLGLTDFNNVLEIAEDVTNVLGTVTSPANGLGVLNTLFSCSNGEVTVLQHCVLGCVAAGANKNDFCLVSL